MKTHCSRFSSNLLTNELLVNQNSKLKKELDHIIEKKFKLNEQDWKKIYGVNRNLQGMFNIRYSYSLNVHFLSNFSSPMKNSNLSIQKWQKVA